MSSPSRVRPPMTDLGRTRALATALTQVERGGVGLAPAVRPPGAVVGIVGPPGVGKSSLIAALVARARARSETVVVLAVDPSSPVTGGAILGDRIRMGQHATDSGTFVRSLASRGHPGGLATSVPAAVETALALGWDRVFVEPVGGGQNDIDIAACADRVVLVVSPESGDDVQALKAGILEFADVVAINKADRPGASQLLRALTGGSGAVRRREVVLVSAADGVGIDELDAVIRAEDVVDADRKQVSQLSALLNDLVIEARRSLRDETLREEVLELLGSGRRRAALLRIIAGMGEDRV